uniref:Target of rapamycin complex subunit lst8 n=1 Tax=Panagrellus redivivus TaxID=6233 RepID=A0A7E4VFX2_PANRE
MSPRPLLVTASHDDSIRYWDIAEERILETIVVKDSQINALAIAPNGNYILAGGYQNVKLFDALHATNQNQALQTYAVHEKNVTSLGFTADAVAIFTGSDDGTARVWDRRSPKLSCMSAFRLNVAINSVALHRNQTEFLVADAAGGLYIWDIRMNKSDSLQLELNSNEFVTCVDIDSASKQVAAITNRGKVFLYSVSDTKILSEGQHPNAALMFRYAAHPSYGLRCRFSPDGKWLITTAGDDLPRLWDVSQALAEQPTLSLKRSFEGEKLPNNRGLENDTWIWDAAFTNDSTKIIIPGTDRVTRLFDIESGNEIRRCTGHAKGITAIAFWDPCSRQR